MVTPHRSTSENHRNFQGRVRLFNAVYQATYELSALCPTCSEMRENEQALSFVEEENPRDNLASLRCPGCKALMDVTLIINEARKEEDGFLLWRRNAIMATLLDEKHPFPSPETLRKKHGEEFHWSLLFHFGSYKDAMRSRGVSDYKDSLLPTSWHNVVRPFLGTMPDSMIGHLVGRSGAAIQQFRAELSKRASTN